MHLNLNFFKKNDPCMSQITWCATFAENASLCHTTFLNLLLIWFILYLWITHYQSHPMPVCCEALFRLFFLIYLFGRNLLDFNLTRNWYPSALQCMVITYNSWSQSFFKKGIMTFSIIHSPSHMHVGEKSRAKHVAELSSPWLCNPSILLTNKFRR